MVLRNAGARIPLPYHRHPMRLCSRSFKKLAKFIARRRELVSTYDAKFAGMRNCRPAQVMGRDQSGHHLYVLRIDFEATRLNRGQLSRDSRPREFGSQVHYIPFLRSPITAGLASGQKIIQCPEILPRGVEYSAVYDLTDAQQAHVIATLKALIS